YKRPPHTLLVRARPGKVKHRVKHRSSDGTSVQSPDHVITDWPISDHFLTSLLTTCEICE
ncbi:unnamed protein product, partial [Staurois parvus]